MQGMYARMPLHWPIIVALANFTTAQLRQNEELE